MGGQHRSHPRRAEDGLPAPPEPWTRAGRCGQQACPLLRRPVLRPRTLDTYGDPHGALAPAALPHAFQRRRRAGGAGLRGRFRDTRTRGELHLASCDRRGEGRHRGGQPGGVLRPRPRTRRHKSLAGDGVLGRGDKYAGRSRNLAGREEDLGRIVALGEVVSDIYRGQEISAVELGFVARPGGAPANVAVAACRLGSEAAFVGSVGEDLFGDFILQALESEGVDTSGVGRQSPPTRTSLAFVEIGADGDREFTFYRSSPAADELLSPEDVTEDLVSGASFVNFGSIPLIREPVRSSTSPPSSNWETTSSRHYSAPTTSRKPLGSSWIAASPWCSSAKDQKAHSTPLRSTAAKYRPSTSVRSWTPPAQATLSSPPPSSTSQANPWKNPGCAKRP